MVAWKGAKPNGQREQSEKTKPQRCGNSKLSSQLLNETFEKPELRLERESGDMDMALSFRQEEEEAGLTPSQRALGRCLAVGGQPELHVHRPPVALMLLLLACE